MTTGKVAQIVSMLKNPELPGMQKQSGEAEVAFGAFLSQTAGGNQDLISSGNLGQNTRNESVNQAAYEKESARSGYRDNTISRNEPADATDRLGQDAGEKLQAFDRKVKEVIAEKLGISEEEVAQQMEAMGLTSMDLLNPSQLADLVMELTGSEDIGGLLLNEDFQQMLGEISDLSQGLAAQLNLTPEEMGQIQEHLESLISQNPDAEAKQNAQEISGNPAEPLPQDTEDVPAVQIRENTALQGEAAVVQGNRTDSGKTDIPEEAGKEMVQQEDAPAAREAVQVQENPEGRQEADSQETDSQETEGRTSGTFKENGTNDKAESRQTHVTYQTTTQTIGQGQTVEVTQTVVQTRVDVESILRQVSQMTRVFVSQAESSVEMQLNPANLGKIYLQVVSREGVITAQIAAQNEAVKEALESQVAVLKENMNQQGMKVEAIEVTIASHEFERNLEENQQNAARQQQEEEAAKAARRNLNLNSLDDPEGMVSEEESLAVRMMSEQGNSMDVTA